MCISMPKPKKPDILPQAPPPPEKPPEAPVLNENKMTSTAQKAKGRQSLRIDLNPSATAGLRI